MSTVSMPAHDVPPALVEWFGRVGGHVVVRYKPPDRPADAPPWLLSGKLRKVAATGAYVTLSGIEMQDGSRRTLDLPLECCTLMPPDYGRRVT